MFPKLPFPFDILFGISFIFAVIIFLTYLSGWYELAELYKTDLKLADSHIAARAKNYRCQISRELNNQGSGPYSIAFLDTGMYLHGGSDSDSTFGVIQPALLIPWQEIRYELLENKYHFHLGNPTISILSLGSKGVRELEQLSGVLISDRVNSN